MSTPSQIEEQPNIPKRIEEIARHHALALSIRAGVNFTTQGPVFDELKSDIAHLLANLTAAHASQTSEHEKRIAELETRNKFLEDYTPKTNLGLIEQVAELTRKLAEATIKVKYFESCAIHTDADETIIIAEIGKLREERDSLAKQLEEEHECHDRHLEEDKTKYDDLIRRHEATCTQLAESQAARLAAEEKVASVVEDTLTLIDHIDRETWESCPIDVRKLQLAMLALRTLTSTEVKP
jgi:hypothetical protein